MEKSIPRKWNQEASRCCCHSKIDFKPKLIGKDKGQFILINGTVNQEDTTNLNTSALNPGTPTYIQKIYTTGPKDRDQLQFNSSRWFQYPTFSNRLIIRTKIEKHLNYYNTSRDLIDIYGIVHPNTKYMLHSASLKQVLCQNTKQILNSGKS